MRRNPFTHMTVIFLILVVAGFIVYSNTIHAVFHFDDVSSILTQPRITTFRPSPIHIIGLTSTTDPLPS